MPNYTRKNLKQCDDSAADREGVEARFGRSHLNSDHLGVSYFRFAPDFKSPFGHRHREQEEAYVVVNGSGQARLDDEVIDLEQWDVVRVAPEVVRAFEAGPDGLEIVAIGGPKPEEGDGVMAEAAWPEPQ
jgi:mannose-6-phosphate isomerase-like protein (cupin superfamily)